MDQQRNESGKHEIIQQLTQEVMRSVHGGTGMTQAAGQGAGKPLASCGLVCAGCWPCGGCSFVTGGTRLTK